MPSFSVGLAQVEARLHTARRRLNLLNLQDAFYRSGSVVVLAATLVLVLTLRGRSVAVSGWAVGGAVVAALVAAALRVRQRWVSVGQMVHLADRAAALDDRLATLLLDPTRARSSCLKDLLLEQILAAAPRWRIDMLAPRRVPRSAFLLAGSLAALIVASFLARAPASPQPATAAQTHPQVARAGGDGSQTGHGAEMVHDGHQPAGGPAAQVPGQSATGERAGLGAASMPGRRSTGNDRGSLSSAPAPAAPASSGAVARQRSAQGGGAAAESSAQSLPGVTDQPGDSHHTALDGDLNRRDRLEGSVGRDGTGPRAQRGDPHRAEPTDRAAASAPKQPSGDQPRSSTAQPPSNSASFPGTGAAAIEGAHASGSATALFGSEGGASAPGSGSQKVSIKLGSFGGVSPSQMEPQRNEPPIVPGAANTASRTTLPPLANDQTPDAVLQKTEVAPEHEALVRQIFTRDE